MKGYWLILGSKIADQDAQTEYGRLWAPIAAKYQARINPTKTPPLLQEARDTARVVVVEFPSLEAAKACYADAAYQDALQYALRASKRDLIMLEGDLG